MATQQKKLSKLVKSDTSMCDYSKSFYFKVWTKWLWKIASCEGFEFQFTTYIRYLDYTCYLVNFELFYTNIRNFFLMNI